MAYLDLKTVSKPNLNAYINDYKCINIKAKPHACNLASAGITISRSWLNSREIVLWQELARHIRKGKS